MPYSVVDLFAGAGGLSLGFRQTEKFDIKVAFENNPIMQKTYKKNHPGVEVCGDVCQADYGQIEKKYGKIDVVIGGPPCQGFSNANRQKNHAISRNNSLVKQYIRAILELRPKAFVMENVSMLKSDVHRFYLCSQDLSMITTKDIKTEITPIVLLEKKFIFNGVLAIIKNSARIKQYLWPEDDYLKLNVIYKTAKNINKLETALEKHKRKLSRISEAHIHEGTNDIILQADSRAFEALLLYYDGTLNIENVKENIEAAVMYQRMLSIALEIIDNDIVVEQYDTEKDLKAEVRSFAVFDYLRAKLAADEDVNGYYIKADVLSAAQFGVPQKRMRFIVMGIRKDISDNVNLPEGQFSDGEYRTVRDAIEDLADIEPIYDVNNDNGIILKKKDNLGELAKVLRDANVLYNHVITKTTEVAMQRFKVLKQGQNFHALSEELKKNTYTDTTRTQNTIYLRLNYDEPSGTVVNVRKSMWIHPTQDRAVSIREAARLQSFPDSFIFIGTKDKQYQQVGNAVPPFMANAIAEKLAEQLKNVLSKEDDLNG